MLEALTIIRNAVGPRVINQNCTFFSCFFYVVWVVLVKLIVRACMSCTDAFKYEHAQGKMILSRNMSADRMGLTALRDNC